MQYEITLPADYDMRIIRDRVATRGARTDDFPGLGLKAYLVRERGRDGSPVNQYAPFYLWADPAGMKRFLYGPGFDGIRTDFGRPAVRTWQGLTLHEGVDRAAPPVTATREVGHVDAARALPDVVDRLAEEAGAVAERPGVVATAAGVDPLDWQVARLTLWAGEAPADAGGERYRVLHVSQPHRDDLRP